MKWLYLCLAVLGAALPLSQFVPASMDGSFSVANLLSELMSTKNLRGIAFDLGIAALTGVVFMIAEARRMKIRLVWLPLLGTVLIGYSFGLPLFLYLRERARTNGSDSQSGINPRIP